MKILYAHTVAVMRLNISRRKKTPIHCLDSVEIPFQDQDWQEISRGQQASIALDRESLARGGIAVSDTCTISLHL